MRTTFAIFFVIGLGGCTLGTIVKEESVHRPRAAHIYAHAHDILSIKPFFSDTREFRNTSQTGDLSLWLTAGLYIVTFDCSSLYKEGHGTIVEINENDTNRIFAVLPSRNYHLMCSPKTVGNIDIKDVGTAPNNSFKPTAGVVPIH
jgi:hypothetical protein